MIIKRTERFDKDFRNLPVNVREKVVNNIIPMFLTNPHDSALHAKRAEGHDNRWHINVDLYYYIILEIEGGIVTFRCIGPRSSYY